MTNRDRHAGSISISLRHPRAVVERAEAFARARSEATGIRIDRAQVLHAAVERGLDSLAADLGGQQG